MSDIRDTNHDGKVSMMEKVKDKLHFGNANHTTGAAYDSRDLNRDGHISTGERLAAGSNTGAYDSRDLNRDGFVSSGERLATGSMGTGAHDSRDLNRDGHISTSERLAAGDRLAGHSGEEARLRLHEEQLAIAKREVGAGEVDIHKRIHEERVQQTVPVRHEEVIVERRPLSGIADPNARIAPQDETMRVALFREEIVTEKFIVPTEEIIVRKQEVVDQQVVGAILRSEHVETVQTSTPALASGMYDARDTNLDGHVSMGEKFKGAAMGNNMTTGAYDARDINRDGHVSMGEKITGAATGAAPLRAARG
jgi:uncharacterized protein (TIGR02271 family)